MSYFFKNGQRVREEGFVIIDGIEHYVKKKFVICDPSLNQRSWNTTEKITDCEKCKKLKPAKFKVTGSSQLSLF